MEFDKEGVYNLKMNLLDKEHDLEHSDVDLNALGQAIDTTFGRSSTPNAPTFSVKLSLGPGPKLHVKYAAIVNFISNRQAVEIKRQYMDESQAVIKQVLTKVKTDYKELAGSSITLTQESTSDEIEMLALNQYNPRKTAYYRRYAIYTIG